VRKADNLPPSSAVVTKSGNLKLLEPSGHLQACNGAAFTCQCYVRCFVTIKFKWASFSMFRQPLVGLGLLIVGPAHSSGFEINNQVHRTVQGSSGRVISLSKRRLPDNTQRPQEKNVHAPSVIRTRNSSKRAAADRRPRWRGTAIGLCGVSCDINFTFVF